MARNRPSFREAMDMAEDMDLPDGAFWAMAHDLAGMDYGEGFAELAPARGSAERKISKRLRAELEAFGEITHPAWHHYQIRKGGVVLADWWPHKRKFRLKGDAKTTAAGLNDTANQKAFLAALKAKFPTEGA